jgi:hypothetical protein
MVTINFSFFFLLQFCKDNPEKLVTQVTDDEDKHTNKNTTQYMFDTTMHKHFCLC